jgi:hypothetical protein
MAREALSLHVQGMIDEGMKIPEPSIRETILNDPEATGATLIEISARLPA